ALPIYSRLPGRRSPPTPRSWRERCEREVGGDRRPGGRELQDARDRRKPLRGRDDGALADLERRKHVASLAVAEALLAAALDADGGHGERRAVRAGHLALEDGGRQREIGRGQDDVIGGVARDGHLALPGAVARSGAGRSEEHTSELQSRFDLVCRLLLEKKKDIHHTIVEHGQFR